MKTETFEDDIDAAVNTIKSGGIILYPTDTIWGIGCDATNKAGIKKIYGLKKRDEKKSMIILVADVHEIEQYVSNPSRKILDYLSIQDAPTTAIFRNATHLPAELINGDGSVAIRNVKDQFCNLLIRKSGHPIVSTSANVSGNNYPETFAAISDEIKQGVDYIVCHRQNDNTFSRPSSIIKLNDRGEIETLR